MRTALARVAPFAVFAAWVSSPAAAAEPVVFAVDPKASHVRVHLGRSGLLKFMGHEHHIEAPLTQGRIEVVEQDPARSSVELRFASAALYVIPGTEPAKDVVKVEERMRGEVLEAARHPEAAFVSTQVRGGGGGGAPLELIVAGTLTLKGRAFPLEIPLEVSQEGESLLAKGELALKLRDVGIEPPSVAGVVKVSNRFRLEFEIRAVRAPAPQP